MTEKIITIVISDCRDCPLIEDRKITEPLNSIAIRPHCSRDGRNLYTGCEAIPIPQDCPLGEPIYIECLKAVRAATNKKSKKDGKQ